MNETRVPESSDNMRQEASGEQYDLVGLSSNENTRKTQEEAKSSEEKTNGSSPLLKIKGTIESVETNLLTAPTVQYDLVSLSSNEKTEKTQEEAKSSEEKTNGSSPLLKVKGTIEPVEINLLTTPTDKEDTEAEVSDYDKSNEEEKKDGPTQSTTKKTNPTPDGDDMLKKDFKAIKSSKSSVENFAHIAGMAEIPGFNYSPAETAKFKIWLHGVVPFFIDEFSFDKILRDKITEYLDSTNILTGLQFLEIPKPPDDEKTRWIFFVNRRGQLDCTDYNHESFTDTGVQNVVLGYDCLVGRREMAALVLAIAGVPPQHNSPDRDTFIEVSMKSIQPGKSSFFKAVSPNQWIFYELKFDFLSAGHYPAHKYTADGTATITAKNKDNEPVGEAEDFSFTDLKKIRMLYNYIASEGSKNLKVSDCQILYRPGPYFKNPKLRRPQKHARKKPQQYIEATAKAGEQILDGRYGVEGKSPDMKPDPKLDPTLSDEANEIFNEFKHGESDDPVTKEHQVDILSSNKSYKNDAKLDPTVIDEVKEKFNELKHGESDDPVNEHQVDILSSNKSYKNDAKLDPTLSDEAKEKFDELKHGESDDPVTKEHQVDILSSNKSYKNDANDTNSLAYKDNARGLSKKKKKRDDSIVDPLKWDDIRTHESD